MRIIGGRYKRKRLIGPPDAETTRPIPDRVKEALFNLLRGHFEGESVFDGFAGTGSVGIEAASRGATRVVCVERDRRIADVLYKNVEHCGADGEVEIYLGDALSPLSLARCPDPVHVVFLDPPYPLVWDPAGWARVRDQFTKLVAKLDDTGFAVLRTPWPFLHGVETAKGGGVSDAVVDLDALSDEELDKLDDEFGRFTAGLEKSEVDLTIDGAIGPETHVYRQTALHLYMRDRGDQDEGDAS